MMRSMPLDDQMMRLKQLAQVREEELRNQASGHPAGLPNEGEEDAGVAVNEHADTWGFAWMPAIEEFVEQAAKTEQRAEEESDCTDDDEASEPRVRTAGRRSRSGSRDPDDGSDGRELLPGGSSGRGGRKRGRPQACGTSWSSSSSSSPSSPSSRRRAPRPPSYNETLLSDKSFHNPHASETMADAFGILRPASFVLDVEADDRPWRGGVEAVAAAKGATAATTNGGGVDSAGAGAGGGGGEDDRNWFYDTVRDRQNRLWADTRVRKGVELARKGQHQAAIDTYTQALGMCPDHDDGLVARGAAFATTGRLRQAVQDLSQALKLNPRNDNASRYLKETRRRMERQDTRTSPGSASAAAVGLASRLENRAGPSSNDKLRLGGTAAGNAERDDASRAALGALLQDGAEADALRKMRALLEEDQRKRKREGEGGEGRGVGGDGGGGSSRKKKSRKKDKKSSAKSKRSSSGRHKKRDRRDSGGGGGARSDSSSSSSGGGGSGSSDAGDNSSVDARSSSSSSKKKKTKKKEKKKEKKKKQHRKHKKRSSAGAGGLGLSGTVSASWSVGGGEDSGDDAHPILQRKKHSLWG